MGSVARVTSAAEGLPRRRFTVAEVEAMVAAGVMEEDERVELIGGSSFRCRQREAATNSSSCAGRLLDTRPPDRLPRGSRDHFSRGHLS